MSETYTPCERKGLILFDSSFVKQVQVYFCCNNQQEGETVSYFLFRKININGQDAVHQKKRVDKVCFIL